MNTKEKEAFFKSYSINVASVSDADLRVFVDRYLAGEDLDYSHDYTSIMDALGVWHDAIAFSLSSNL
jgi:hypothetical protein